MCRRPFLATLLVLLAASSIRGEPDFEPRLLDATIQVGDTAHKPVERRSHGGEGFRLGDLRLRFERAKLVAEHTQSGERAWEVGATASDLRRVLAEGEGILYLPTGRGAGGPLRVRRVGMADGRALPPLLIASDTPRGEEVKAALPLAGKRVVVLSGAGRRGGPSFARMTAFAERKVIWSRKLEVGDAWCPRAGLPVPGGARRKPGPGVLTAIGEHVAVLPGNREALFLLHAETGEEIARVKDIWAFERTFIGPSVWRYGVGVGVVPDDGEEYARQRKLRFVSCGPVVVGDRIYLAVDRSPTEYSRGYLVETDVVEIGEHGQRISITRMPRPIRELRPYADGVLTLGQGAFLGFLTPSIKREGGPFFLAGGDAVGHLAWWREMVGPSLRPVPEPPGEFTSSSGMTTGKGYLTAVGEGRTVLYTEEALETWDQPGVLRILFVIAPFEGGQELRGEVRIPFSGPFPKQTTATCSREREDGTKFRTLSATDRVRIKSVEAEPGRLTITLEGPGKETAELRFNL